jgi:pyruvate formate lyase activating enzyme
MNDSGMVFNIQRFCLHDGPGLRTTVFFKGCPLKCKWCANPEAINPLPQLGVAEVHCNSCGDCVPACPEKAISLDESGKPQINRKLCKACGTCASVCFQEALTVYGQSRTVEEVYQEVMKDKAWYDTEGGLTVSGGEPLMQPVFVVNLFKQCKEAEVSTCIETSGCVAAEVLKKVLEYTDIVLFDLKHMDSKEHKNLTGLSNDLILGNARIVANSGVQVQFRMPLIPGLNNTIDNIKATSGFLRELMGDKASIELMPYHALGKGKYDALDLVYTLPVTMAETEVINTAQEFFAKEGVDCFVSF